MEGHQLLVLLSSGKTQQASFQNTHTQTHYPLHGYSPRLHCCIVLINEPQLSSSFCGSLKQLPGYAISDQECREHRQGSWTPRALHTIFIQAAAKIFLPVFAAAGAQHKRSSSISCGKIDGDCGIKAGNSLSPSWKIRAYKN